MPDGLDWLWRPVARKMMRAESLDDPTISLDLVAECNEMIDVLDENEFRLTPATPGGE